MRARYALALALTAGMLHAQTAPRPQADPALQAKVDAIVAAHHGKIALYAEQLNTVKMLAVDGDKAVQTASTIKLAMLWTAMREVALGHAAWSDKITLQPGDAVPGSGILRFLDAPVTLTLKDVATMMVIVSDNTGTNLMIDRFTTKLVDDNMAALGYDQTVLYKKVFKPAVGSMPADQPKFGLGKTTPRQIVQLMERIGKCDVNLPQQPAVDQAKADAACKVAIDMLRNQFYRNTVPRYLETLDNTEAGSGIASKTGSLDATRSDVAIVAGKSGPIVLAVYTYDNADKSWTADNEGERAIGSIAKAIVEAWSPTGIDGKSLVPGLGLRAGTAK